MPIDAVGRSGGRGRDRGGGWDFDDEDWRSSAAARRRRRDEDEPGEPREDDDDDGAVPTSRHNKGSIVAEDRPHCYGAYRSDVVGDRTETDLDPGMNANARKNSDGGGGGNGGGGDDACLTTGNDGRKREEDELEYGNDGEGIKVRDDHNEEEEEEEGEEDDVRYGEEHQTAMTIEKSLSSMAISEHTPAGESANNAESPSVTTGNDNEYTESDGENDKENHHEEEEGEDNDDAIITSSLTSSVQLLPRQASTTIPPSSESRAARKKKKEGVDDPSQVGGILLRVRPPRYNRGGGSGEIAGGRRRGATSYSSQRHEEGSDDDEDEDDADDDDDDADDADDDDDYPRDHVDVDDGDDDGIPSDADDSRPLRGGGRRRPKNDSPLRASKQPADDGSGGGNRGRSSATTATTRPAPPRPGGGKAPSAPVRPPPAVSACSSLRRSAVSGRSDVAIAPSPLAAHHRRQQQHRRGGDKSVVSGRSDVAIAPSPLAAHHHRRQQRLGGKPDKRDGQQPRLKPAGILRGKKQRDIREDNTNSRLAHSNDRAPANGPRIGRWQEKTRHEERPLTMMRSNSNVSNASFATSGAVSNVALDGFGYPNKGRRPSMKEGDGGGGGGGRGGIFSPIRWTKNLISRKVARRDKTRHNDVRIRSDDDYNDYAEQEQLFRHPPMVIGSPATAPLRYEDVNLQQLRRRPPLVITSPTNNDRITMQSVFEGYDHLRFSSEQGVATSRTLPKADDRNKDRTTAANSRKDVNPWASMTGGVPQLGEADVAFPDSNNNDIEPLPCSLKSDGISPPGGVPQSGEANKTVPGMDEPFPFAFNSAGVSPHPGQYDLTTGAGMPAFKWWTWKQQSPSFFCDGANSAKEERAGRSGQQQGQQSQPEGDGTYFAFLCMLPNAAS